WQSEIMRVMDKSMFGNRENLGVRPLHEKFQAEASVTSIEKAEEGRLFAARSGRYEYDGYTTFRNKLGFHVDLEEAMKKPFIGGDLHVMSHLILDWYKCVGTILYKGEPKF